jgi:transposase
MLSKKGLRSRANSDSCLGAAGDSAMMGRQDRDQGQLFYEFSLDEMIPTNHLLRRINVFATAVLADLHHQLRAFYSDIGRPSVDPELMIRMLLVGYCYGIRHERRLCQEVALHLAYRWFCKLDLDDKVPHHSTFIRVRAQLSRRARSHCRR